METRAYAVAGMHCAHCKHAVETEVGALAGVGAVDADVERGLVTVTGEALDDEAIHGAIAEAGYEVG